MNNKRIARIIAILLAVLMLLPLLISAFSMLVPASAAVTQEEIDELVEENNRRAEERKELAAELDAVQNDKAQAVAAKRLLDKEMALLDEQIAATEQIILGFDDVIAQKEIELAQAIEEEEEQYALFCRRVRAMEEEGSVSYLSILFGAKDFSDLLDKINIVNDVVEYDNAVANMLEQMREEVEISKAAVQTARDAQQEQKDLLEEQKGALAEKIKVAQALVREIQEKEDEYEKAIAEYKAAEDAAAREIDRLQREFDIQNYTFDVGSGYYWPLPGYYKLSSLFGPRTHPITGKFHSHTGIDVPAPRGTPILAARGGVVLLARYNYSYGNYVSISHGNNESTLYAHMTSYCVSEGDVVTQGQVIGYVGTTGSSTGNHLHFEVRINGERRNAVNYYPSLKSKIYYQDSYITSYDWSFLTQNQ